MFPFIFFFFLFSSVALPLSLVFFLFPRWTGSALGVYLIYALSLLVLIRRHAHALDKLKLRQEEVQEGLNVSERERLRLLDLRAALAKKIKNYERLEKFTQRLNNEISLDRICDIVVGELFDVFGGEGNVLLYLVNDRTRRPELRCLRKQDPALQIRDKTGDLFDLWVLRHNQPLLVEDVLGDFRFDPEKTSSKLSRPIGSLINVPMVTEACVIGLLRVDAPLPKAFFSDDLRFLSVIADIAKLAIENAVYFTDMQALSVMDGLTGLFLRRHGTERLKEEFLRAQREGTPLSFLMLDIDRFKEFNDRFGHMGGDVVLKKTARFIKAFFDFSNALAFRYGGEEFCVLLPLVQKKEAFRLAESFLKFIRDKVFVLRGEKIKITVSAGVASFPDDTSTFEDLIRFSDEALLKAKQNGRNRVCCR